MSRQFYSMDRRYGEIHIIHKKEYRSSSTNACEESYSWSGQTMYPTLTLWKMTKQLPIENERKSRKWRWIGHTLGKSQETIISQATTWSPPWNRRRGRPRKNTWQRDTERGKEMGYTRRKMERMATDRKWRSLVDGLFFQRANRHM